MNETQANQRAAKAVAFWKGYFHDRDIIDDPKIVFNPVLRRLETIAEDKQLEKVMEGK